MACGLSKRVRIVSQAVKSGMQVARSFSDLRVVFRAASAVDTPEIQLQVVINDSHSGVTKREWGLSLNKGKDCPFFCLSKRCSGVSRILLR